MPIKPTVWRSIAIALSAVNLAGVGLAAGDGEGLHAALHAALAVVFGLWAQRVRPDGAGRGVSGQAGAPGMDRDRVEALETDVADIRRELGEAQERLDFAERLLAQRRDPRRVGPEQHGGG